MQKKSVTLKDVAKVAGVSFITVSRVVNKSGYVSKEKKEKVLKAIKTTNYKPNLIARSLKLKRTKTLGFLLPDILNPYLNRLTNEIEQFAYEKGYNVMLCITESDAKREKDYIDSLKGKITDGYIIFPANTKKDNNYSKIFKNENVVSLQKKINLEGETCIKINNYDAMKLALEHIIKLGHKRIGIVNIPVNYFAGYQRFEGYKKVLLENGIEINNDLIKFTNYKNKRRRIMELIENAKEKTLELLDLKVKPTAIISTGIYASIGILQAFTKKKVLVPDDISFISFDELYEYSGLLNFNPTVLRQPAVKIGRLAIELILKKIEGNKSLEKVIEVKPELVIRDSCKKII